ncbi:MAG: phenylpyruvate tautomerase MIF-related protein [Methyloprofundus sp.]|nr:phenylpyruvate tautomerase MIF-related protein [Methyloprofundus sp.]MDT8424759.1 phenylpyruvate tautomerase MIF-related protein [Methyloprofundus sp.]
MPFMKLRTNVVIDSEKTSVLMSELSQLLAHETSKPERYVMIDVQGDRNMMFAGSTESLAFVECKSIGLSTAQAKSLSKSISELLSMRLQLSAERIYIEFSHCPAEYWGWNGSTFG